MGIIKENIEGKKISVEILSSNLQSAVYDTESEDLSVTFNNGSIYEYESVPLEVFENFKKAESQGKFFNTNISKIYKYKRVK